MSEHGDFWTRFCEESRWPLRRLCGVALSLGQGWLAYPSFFPPPGRGEKLVSSTLPPLTL